MSKVDDNALVCTVLPTFNESGNITDLIERLMANVSPPYLVLVIDDDSPDQTWKIVAGMAASAPYSPGDKEIKSGIALPGFLTN